MCLHPAGKNMKQNSVIALTGWGSLSALGSEKDDIIKSYESAQTCLKNKIFNQKEYPVAVLHPSAEKELNELIARDKKFKRLDRLVLMALISASKAYKMANWSNKNFTNIGVNIGSSRGATGLWETLHEEFLSSPNKQAFLLTSPLTTLGNVSSEVAAFLNTTGPIISNSTTCSTAFQAIGNAIAWLKADMADAFIAGGSEAPLTKFTLAQTEALGIYTQQIHTDYPARPFSNEKIQMNSFTLGEGAAIFTLEKINSTELNIIKPTAIIESIGFAFEPPPSATGLNPDGFLLFKSMQNALQQMITPEPVDLLLLHGTGTLKGDAAEMNAVKNCFAENIPNLYTNKWKVGHSYGASAALHLELALLCIQNNLKLTLPYPSIINNHEKRIRKVMINATGFGGNAASLIISNYF